MGNSTTALQIVKHRPSTQRPSNFTLRYIPKMIENRYSNKCLFKMFTAALCTVAKCRNNPKVHQEMN